jgi:hypothetical protein
MHFMYGFWDGNSLAALIGSDRRQPYRRVYETARRYLRETGTVMPHARARGRRIVRDEEDVLGIVPSTSTRHISSATGRLSQRAVWRTLQENQLYFFMYNQHKGCSQDRNISVHSSLEGCYTRLRTPRNFRAVYLQEVVYPIHTTCMCGQRKFLMLLVTPHSSTDLGSTFGPNCI